MQPPEQVVVRFEGDGAGEGPLSWGQTENWRAIQRQQTWLPLGGVQPLPADSTVAGVAGELRYLLSRFPSLRTRLRLTDGGRPVQVVAGSGEIMLEVYDAGGRDPGAVAGEVHDRYRDTDLDFTAEWPIRMAAVRKDGGLTHLVALLSHFAVDATGAAVMLAGVSTGDATPVTGQQPLDQADWQRSPAGRRHNAAALRYWDGILRTLAPRRFPDPVVRTSPRYWQGEFVSPDLHHAVRAIVRRTGVDSSTVLVALYAAALGQVSGVDPVAIRPTVSNRFRAGLSDVVCTLVQAGLLMVHVAGTPFDEVLERTRRLTLPAYKYAYFDPDDVAELLDRVASDRGAPVEIGCFYNDRRGPDRERDLDAPHDAPSVSGLRWVSKQDAPAVEPLFVHVDDAPGTMRLTIQLDADYISPADGEAVLRAMESIAAGAAPGPAGP
ncbi:condensation domain-containing protein [Dactylosporangium sp. NBC_01737]|uniref:condensation domain-containing protein n=1 Tax=Dactylosporangium sp. NBC_01737 TaxID=2975959 RepID=UPI002E1575C9|nr:condensation domain-containing protein [Dactylosporangium sp. NBC_01737]